MKNKIFSIWLIGPTASGKTTVAKLIYEKLKKDLPKFSYSRR